jgi:hypothetical protein
VEEKFIEVGGPGGFIVRKIVVPPITVDCSQWVEVTGLDWAEGKFETNKLVVPPVVETQQPTKPQE